MLTEHSEIDRTKIAEVLNKKDVKIYFIGIGGISTSAIANALLLRGVRVFGSDKELNENIEELDRKGAVTVCPHSPEFLIKADPDLVVYTLAIDSENAEYVAARRMKKPCISRAELLGVLIDESRFSIGVSGSHGKSTVTAMLSHIYEAAGLRPSVFCGARIGESGGFKAGRDVMIYEACEYRNSFLHFSPDISVMLNLDIDHTDFFRDIEDLRASFASAATLAKRAVLISADDENLAPVLAGLKGRVRTFGKSEGADYRYEILSENKGKCSIAVFYKGDPLVKCTLSVAGEFNAANAAAAIAASQMAGIEPGTAASAIASFKGLPRRLEKISEGQGKALFYDYAHHPTEIRASLTALRSMGYSRIGVVFSPHTYSRTASLWREFAEALALSDECVVTDIYAAREEPIPAVDPARLAAAVRGSGGKAVYRTPEFASAAIIDSSVDAIVVMGAGDMTRIKRDLMSVLKK